MVQPTSCHQRLELRFAHALLNLKYCLQGISSSCCFLFSGVFVRFCQDLIFQLERLFRDFWGLPMQSSERQGMMFLAHGWTWGSAMSIFVQSREALCRDLKGKFAALAKNAVDYVVWFLAREDVLSVP